jgi:hypothetical protein
VPTYRGKEVQIDLEYVLHRLRIDDTQAARNRPYVEALTEGLPVVTDLAVPMVFHQGRELLWEEPLTLRVDGTLMQVGELVQRHLSEAQSLCIGIATIGRGVEEEAARAKKERGMLHSLALEALGAIALDISLEGYFREYENRLDGEGLYVGVPMSPGETVGWDTRDQCSIFSILEEQLTDVSITESCLLIPRNSVSFIVGIYDHPVKKEGDSHCNYCSMRDSCLYRRQQS